MTNLIATLEGLTSPRREVDEAMRIHFKYPPKPWNYTASLDATVALCERVLPGWTWRVATCHVSDDAWVIPDFNHPIHGERLMREFGQVEGDPTTYWQEITDVDLRPSGRPAIALLIALLRALEARDA